MENASKALIMAAGVLLGVMVISLGTYLFSVFGGSSREISGQIEQNKISEFIVQFTKYLGIETLRVHDVVNIANLAMENNKNYYGNDFNILKNSKNEPFYIQVKLENSGSYSTSNLELNENKFEDFIKEYSLKISGNTTTPIYFKCTSVEINPNTKFVWKITFKKL